MTDVFDALVMGTLALAGVLALARVLREGSLADKILGADTFIIIVGTGVAAGAAISGETRFLDVVVAVATLAFIGTLTVARFIERRGAGRDVPARSPREVG